MTLQTEFAKNGIQTVATALTEMLIVAAAYTARATEIQSTGTVLGLTLSDGGIATIYIPMELAKSVILQNKAQFSYFKFGLAAAAAIIENTAMSIGYPLVASGGDPLGIPHSIQANPLCETETLIKLVMTTWIAEAVKDGIDMSLVITFPMAILFTRSWVQFLKSNFGVIEG